MNTVCKGEEEGGIQWGGEVRKYVREREVCNGEGEEGEGEGRM